MLKKGTHVDLALTLYLSDVDFQTYVDEHLLLLRERGFPLPTEIGDCFALRSNHGQHTFANQLLESYERQQEKEPYEVS